MALYPERPVTEPSLAHAKRTQLPHTLTRVATAAAKAGLQQTVIDLQVSRGIHQLGRLFRRRGPRDNAPATMLRAPYPQGPHHEDSPTCFAVCSFAFRARAKTEKPAFWYDLYLKLIP